MISKQAGRLKLSANHLGNVTLDYLDGWNDSCQRRQVHLSLEELYDLKHMAERVIVAVEARKPRE